MSASEPRRGTGDDDGGEFHSSDLELFSQPSHAAFSMPSNAPNAAPQQGGSGSTTSAQPAIQQQGNPQQPLILTPSRLRIDSRVLVAHTTSQWLMNALFATFILLKVRGTHASSQPPFEAHPPNALYAACRALAERFVVVDLRPYVDKLRIRSGIEHRRPLLHGEGRMQSRRKPMHVSRMDLLKLTILRSLRA